MSCLEELNAKYPQRNSLEQKAAFRRWAAEQAEKNSFTVREEENEGHINLVIGDPEKASVLFTAHYDTPRRSLFPNLLLPTKMWLKILYTFGILIPILAVAVLAGVSAGAAFGGFESFIGRLGGLAVYMVIYFGFYCLLFRGPANLSNKNDNTSGSAAVLDLTVSLSGIKEAAFILFDDEEKGKKGSKAWTAAHSALKENLLTINMDCVGNGEHFIVSVPEEAEKDAAWAAFRKALEGIGAKLYPSRKASMNSDQKNFRKGVGICACLFGKVIGYYTPRIHTKNDTVASEETVDRLTKALTSGIK